LERFEATFEAQHPELAAPTIADAHLHRRLGLETWPTADLSAAGDNGHPSVEWPAAELAAIVEPVAEPEPFVEPEPVAAEAKPVPVIEPEPVAPEVEPVPFVAPERIAAEVEPVPFVAPEPEPVAAAAEPVWEPVVEPERIAAEADETWAPPTLTVLEWEADATIDLEPEPEPYVAPFLEVMPEPEPVAAEAAPALEPEPFVEPEPEPVAAEVEPEPFVEPEPEPVAAEVEPEPIVEPKPRPTRPAPHPQPIRPVSETILRVPRPLPAHPPTEEERVAAAADSASMAARRAQLEELGLGDPGEGPVGPQRGGVLPYRSRGASPHPVELAAVGGSFWEASAREVAGAISSVGVQSCGTCGLSLSASARFCRRCGTGQARSA
jgi:hypothetical protein